MGRERSPERKEFLATIMFEAVCNNGGYSQMYTVNETFSPDLVFTGDEMAYVIEKEDSPNDEMLSDIDVATDSRVHRVTIDTIAHGISVISRATLQELTGGFDNGEKVLHNRQGERMYLSQQMRREIISASITNDACGGEAGDIDILHCLAILECGLFGRVVFG